MKKVLIVIGIVILGTVASFFWWKFNKLPVNPLDKSQKVFVVSKQENVRDIAYDLRKQGLIRSPVVFFLTIKYLNLESKIQAGDFRLSPSMSTDQIALNLTHGTLDVWVTITEGKRATEIAEILSQKISSYDASFATALATQEGYLFPDTYLFPTDASVSQIMSIMENNFNQKYQEAAKDQTSKLTKEQAVILASILEREGKSAQDMKIVASILENRLSIGMALQVDATIQYALGYQPAEQTWWKKNLTEQDLKIDSPYNTYLNPGLPPTPISSPGYNSLYAVLHPADTNYLYYISDAKGVLHFAKTLDEHNANIRKYGQ